MPTIKRSNISKLVSAATRNIVKATAGNKTTVSTGRLEDAVSSVLLAVLDMYGELPNGLSRTAEEYALAAKHSRASKAAAGSKKVPWMPWEERTIEYLTYVRSFQRYEGTTKDGAPNNDLVTKALNDIFYDGNKIRTKDSIEAKRNKMGRIKPPSKPKDITQDQRKRILSKKQHHEELEGKLIKYFSANSGFQNQYREPNITKLTEAVNYIFYDNSNVRTISYVKNTLS